MNQAEPAPANQRTPGRPAGPCALVIFGASGDLTQRKLIPALLNLAHDRLLPDQFAVLGVSRSKMSDDDFRKKLAAEQRELQGDKLDAAAWEWLAPRLHYHAGDLNDPATYAALRQRLEGFDRERGTGGNYLFYLSTAPQHFASAVRRLGEAGLTDEENARWRRVVIEKPFGRDLASARALNRDLRANLAESQIYRIDHYLGKETVQNLMVFRFSNGIFEPLWNRRYVDHVQISVGESLGVEGRGAYYDTSGALRDMVPNHLFQLLSLVGMEPPASLESDAMRDEQVKLLKAVRPITPNEVPQVAVRAQYAAGTIDGKAVPGYRDEPSVPRDSSTETYVALRLHVDNWRWSGVPFYLRTGKRLAQRRTEIVIQFKRAPHLLFRSTEIESCLANQLVLGIQPHEGVSLRFGAKVPGPVVRLGTVTMDFDYARVFGRHPSTGYERLLYDAMLGDATLFQRADMVELGWAIVAPLQEAWSRSKSDGMASYAAGSGGPAEADELLARDGRRWREDEGCA